MYGLYQKQELAGGARYSFVEETSLYGCNVGWIPKLLRPLVPANQNEPYTWQIDISKSLEQAGKQNHALVINLKPKSAKLSLYELVNVWGFSNDTWTPIMMHLRGLYEEAERAGVNDKDFTRRHAEISDPIFSMTYLSGSISNGKLLGRWTTPGQSSTNSVLLGPETFRYFIQEAQKIHQNLRGSSLI
jgi:hypothetical protein